MENNKDAKVITTEQLIEQLKTAKTITGIALATARLLRACGVWNFQAVAHELGRMSVTGGPE